MNKAVLSISALALIAGIFISQTSQAMRWTPRGRSANLIDCRSGWYCSQGGWINIRASWDHIYSRYF
ncbi:MAG: hypothetical protein ABL958_20015 [Bdellovibrionia bacterium]